MSGVPDHDTRPTPHPRTPDGRHHERDGAVHVTRLPGYPTQLSSRLRIPKHRENSLMAHIRGGAA